jgi:hypothetical protein
MLASLGVRMHKLIPIGQFEPDVYFNPRLIKKFTRLKIYS